MKKQVMPKRILCKKSIKKTTLSPCLKAGIVTLALMLGMADANAQSAVVTLPSKNLTVGSFFKTVEKQTNYLVVYGNCGLNTKQNVKFTKTKGSVKSFLAELLNGRQITYDFSDNYIVFSEKAKQTRTAPTTQKPRTGKNVHGHVTDANGEPLIGVSVVAKGQKTGTVTDIDGNFELDAQPGTTLTFSYIGYKTSQKQANNDMRVRLEEDNNVLSDVVVVGYGVQKKVNLTGSVASMDAKKIEQMPAATLTSALAGKMSGVYISQSGGGKPGGSSSLQIRTNDTWNTASPLYVIDGVVRDKFAFDGLDASEVENISVLKDGASAAIYGARAANGVVLVTTKKGEMGKPKINYLGSIGWEKATRIPERLNAYEQATIINDGLAEEGYDSSSPNW